MKVVFWAVDCQKDFINKDGALYIKGAESIKPNLKILTDYAEDNYITVVSTRDYHNLDDIELSAEPDFIDTFPNHCLINTQGCEFIDEIKTTTEFDDITTIENTTKDQFINLYSRNFIIDKNMFDVFEGNLHTEDFLKCINPDLVVIYGVATNVCVNQAVLGLDDRGYNLLVVEDAIKELSNLPVEEIFREWDKRGILRVTTKQIIEKVGTVGTWKK